MGSDREYDRLLREDDAGEKALRRSGYASGGGISKAEDEKQDRRETAAAVHKHERHLHKGEPETKLARGGPAHGKSRGKAPTHVNVIVATPGGGGGNAAAAAQQGLNVGRQQGLRAGAAMAQRGAGAPPMGRPAAPPPRPPMAPPAGPGPGAGAGPMPPPGAMGAKRGGGVKRKR